MNNYKCSRCGTRAYYDGRMGDGPILTCGCNKGIWINDGRGGYYSNPQNAEPITGDDWNDEDYEYWNKGRG